MMRRIRDYLGSTPYTMAVILIVGLFIRMSAPTQADTQRLPVVYGSVEYAPRPASLPLPAGYRCFANTTPYLRYAGFFYGACQLSMPGGAPSGVMVYRSLDGSSSEFVLATGKNAGPGLLTVDTDGALILSYFVVAEQRQYLQVVQP